MALNWNKYSKTSTRRNINYDCSVRLNGNGDKAHSVSVVFRFYDGVEKKFINGSDYMLFTTNDEGNRVYFIGSDPINGYKIYKTNKATDDSKSMQRKITEAQKKVWLSRVGDYNILYDKEEKLYYIDLDRKA
jgi:hypothetical protein